MRTASLPASLLSVAIGPLLVACLVSPVLAQDRTLEFTDLMQIREIERPVLSRDGAWVAFTAEPDRGDPEAIVRSTSDGGARYAVPLASHPLISADGTHVVMRLNPSLEARETLEGDDAPRPGMAVLTTADGAVERVDDVQSFEMSEDGRWLVYHHFAPPENGSENGSEEDAFDREPGTLLVLRDLTSGAEVQVPEVRVYEFDGDGRYLAYAVAVADNSRDGLYVRDLSAGTEREVHTGEYGHYASLTWSDDDPDLAFVASTENPDGKPGDGMVMAWNGDSTRELAGSATAPEGWVIPANSALTWSDEASRLFFGWRPLRADELASRVEAEGGGDRDEAQADTGDDDPEPFDAYDLSDILSNRGVDVWHWLDPWIMPQQKVEWDDEKDRTYLAVAHLASGDVVALGDPELPQVEVPENADVALARTDVPYRRQATWAGGRSDAVLVDLVSGDRTMVAAALRSQPSLSPGGRYVAYYKDGDYHLYDVAAGVARTVTSELGVPIADEDHDYPSPAPGYGLGGWLENDAAVLVYDKYDIWVVPTDGEGPWSLTDGAGRPAHRIFRVVDTDPETGTIGTEDDLLLSSYHDLNKGFGFYRAEASRSGVQALIEDAKRFRFLARAEDADVLLYTREAYDEFPDLWISDRDFGGARKVTDVNPQIDEFAWGTAELTEWRSLDGRPLQGVVIKPGNYEEGKRYPVLVYYYRFFSQRLHEFNDPSINHRPSFPIYASDGYVVFLPDVRFEVGRPGFASTKSVVPGVQHLIDIGLADPNAITLHGHSWSGYQTAFMVTQTDIFTTAIAGAPVGNMTSAYSGIRLGSGLARQFQYEQGQSRLSGSLWEARDEYIDNSPIFFADRINTPMLILHGDVDDAVPWEQSIELYLALRRLEKEAVFLQYRGEPHHPQTYSNKLDWAMKMKEWNDHYLKGEPAPKWITEGEPYRGR